MALIPSVVSRQRQLHPKGKQERLERHEHGRGLKLDAHSRKLELGQPFLTPLKKVKPCKRKTELVDHQSVLKLVPHT